MSDELKPFIEYAKILQGQKTRPDSVVLELWDHKITKQDFLNLLTPAPQGDAVCNNCQMEMEACPEGTDFDVGSLDFALAYWGNLQYEDGCKFAHHLLLKYRDTLYRLVTNNAALQQQTVSTSSDVEAVNGTFPVDVGKIRQEICQFLDNRPHSSILHGEERRNICQAVDYLAERGYLRTLLEKVEGLGEALEVASIHERECGGVAFSNAANAAKKAFKDKYGKHFEMSLKQAARKYHELTET